jgi:CRP/FNR family transcriptional regulator
MLDTETLTVIKQAPVFSQLDDRTLRAFVEQCQAIRVKAGAQVLRPSQLADRFFAVISGQVKIYKLSPRGDEQILHLYGPGETFGEAAMWAKIDFPAHAEAVEDSRLLVVPRETLRRALADNAELAMGMLAGLSAKLREFNLLIERLSLMEVPARLAGTLLQLARSVTSPLKGEVAPKGRVRVSPTKPDSPISFRLPQSKRELAGQIGTVPETLSRALAKMKKQGVIQVKGSQIRVLDMDALRELAEE